jgi:hypothetical protein
MSMPDETITFMGINGTLARADTLGMARGSDRMISLHFWHMFHGKSGKVEVHVHNFHVILESSKSKRNLTVVHKRLLAIDRLQVVTARHPLEVVWPYYVIRCPGSGWPHSHADARGPRIVLSSLRPVQVVPVSL